MAANEGSGYSGGDSTKDNLNQQYDPGDVAMITVMTAMVMIMNFGIGFFYSGLAQRKSALSLHWLILVAMSVTFFQWYFWGYSLAFARTASSGYIGNLSNFALQGVVGRPSVGSKSIPDLVFCNFQGMFAAVTIVLITGAAAERGRVFPVAVFAFFWLSIVYCPIAYWVWNPNGWAYKWNVYDYAGGGPVEIGSGVGALAYSFILGPRRPTANIGAHSRHSVTSIVLGTALLWFGWLGFNGGSALGANLRAVFSMTNTNIAGAVSGMTWCFLDFRLERKWTVVGFCSGVIAGLVAATPASGYIPLHASVLLGILSGSSSNYATKLKFLLRIDDSMDVFAEHGVGGMTGLIMNAFFAANYVVGLDGSTIGADAIEGGWLNHNWKQLYKQIVYIIATSGYVFTMTCIICVIMNYFPLLRLHIRVSAEGEEQGIDHDQLGEFAYDYIEVRRSHLDMSHEQSVPQYLEGQQAEDNDEHDPGSSARLNYGDRHEKGDMSESLGSSSAPPVQMHRQASPERPRSDIEMDEIKQP